MAFTRINTPKDDIPPFQGFKKLVKICNYHNIPSGFKKTFEISFFGLDAFALSTKVFKH